MPKVVAAKTRIVQRVIDVLEFFDDEHPQATVMDIARRYDWPQSSTSELVSSLVEIGLLYKDPGSRSFSLTPRAAMLCIARQPPIVRDGRLNGLMERLSAQTGVGVGVFSLVGLKAQVCKWRGSKRPLRHTVSGGLCSGQLEHLTDLAPGWLLLSALPQPRRDGMIRRLNAEASDERKFCFGEMAERVQRCGADGYAIGAAGFGSHAECAAVLLPGMSVAQPLAIGFVYEPAEQIDRTKLSLSLSAAVAKCSTNEPADSTSLQPLFEDWNTKRVMKHG